MKRDFDKPLLDLDGNPFTDQATLKSVAFLVLSAALEGDQALPADQKLKQFSLLQTIHKGGVVEISAEDISLIKSRGAKCLSVIAFGRLCEMLEE